MITIDDPGSIWDLPAGPRATKARRVGLWWVRRVSMRHRMRQASKARRRRRERLALYRDLIASGLNGVVDELRLTGIKLLIKYINRDAIEVRVNYTDPADHAVTFDVKL